MKYDVKPIRVSVIIPCYNEEVVLEKTLSSLFEYTSEILIHEVIVVDNGSTDNSASIAEKLGCLVIHRPDCRTVAEVRNEGVKESSGDVLLFLDSDVQLTEEWKENIGGVLEDLSLQKSIVGSHCSVPKESGYIGKHWFSAIESSSASHVGTGHMLVSRATFDLLGGFDGSLKSGEDYNLCDRLKQRGGAVIEDQSLKVFHEGYPLTLGQFYKRERWHGVGDWSSVGSVLKSKVLLVSLVFVIICLTIPVVSAFSLRAGALLMVATIFYVFSLSVYKFGVAGGIWSILVRACLFSIYMTARVFSLFSLQTHRK